MLGGGGTWNDAVLPNTASNLQEIDFRYISIPSEMEYDGSFDTLVTIVQILTL